MSTEGSPGGAQPMQLDGSGPLTGCRVIELPGGPQLPAGHSLASLGAEVIKVEPPGGDPARLLPPLAGDADSPIGLFWAGYSGGKRSVTADLSTAEGRDLVARLAAEADVVIESYPPGVLASWGLGYSDLAKRNPRLILASITPFGQTGPYASWKGSDLVHFAMGGYLYMTGNKDGTPIKPSAPYQSWLFGSIHLVSAILLTLRQRKRTGRGAHIDEAMRDTGMWMLTHTYQFWDMAGINLHRHGAQRDIGGAVRLPYLYRCSDGYVVWMFQTGQRAYTTRLLVSWMAEHGMAPGWLHEQDWDTFDLLTAPAGMAEQLAETFGAFFLTKSKSDLLEWALTSGVMMAPMQTLEDLLGDKQLTARESWRTMTLPGQGTAVRLPGPPIRMADGAWEPRAGLPGPGADNAEVYGALGETEARLREFTRQGVI